MTGQPIAVKFEIDPSATARAATTAAPAPTVLAPVNSKRALEALPLFKRAKEVLGAEIRGIDEDFNPLAAPQAKRNRDPDSEADTDEG